MVASPLWGHFLKLKRADDHRRLLHEAISTHNQEKPYETSYETVGGREIVVSVDFSNRTPHQRALMLWRILTGDVVHQLRAALDNMVYSLTKRTGSPIPSRRGDPWRDVVFPIVEDPTYWDRAVERCLWGVPDEALPILHRLQPFAVDPDNTASTPIAVLNRLWNEDKHRAIPLLDVRVQLLGFDELSDVGVSVLSGPITSLDFTQGEVEVARLAFADDVDIRTVFEHLDNRLRFGLEVGLDPSLHQVASRGLLTASLDALYDATQSALLRFQPFFPAA